MTIDIPLQLRSERDTLISDIREAFANVSRAGGMSWADSKLADCPGDAAYAAACRLECDTHWTQLLDNPEWHSDLGIGGFSFLDAIGMRYYLPAAMIRTLDSGYDRGIVFHLGPLGGERLEKWRTAKLVLLDVPQRRCVARFLLLMARWSESANDSCCDREFSIALDSEWRTYLDGTGS